MNDPAKRWLLPDGIVEILPAEARRLEGLRRRLLDVFEVWGYELVMPPFIEYIESLLTGTGHDLDLQTFKLTDQVTGRLMGLRADMTPQVARIDAHSLHRSGPSRLCYIGTVLHTRPDGFAGSRSPLQVGAELFGHAGMDSDLEVISLMLETLHEAGVADVNVDLGHVGIYREVTRLAGLDAADEAELFAMLQRKSMPEIRGFVERLGMVEPVANMVCKLAALSGDREVLEQARQVLAPGGEPMMQALDYLDALADRVQSRYPAARVHIDVSELRGYHYHTGVVFAAYTPAQGQEIARGGRYDEVGKVFGRARPATGFTTDLRTLIMVGARADEQGPMPRIVAPAGDDAELLAEMRRLRGEGEIVVQTLGGANGPEAGAEGDRVLRRGSGGWEVVEE